MEIILSNNADELGQKAAQLAEKIINKAIDEKGYARIVLSTGASQFTTFNALLNSNIDWSKVEMFHLDEYIGIDSSHPASFVKYLKERFVSKVNLKAVYYVDTTIDINILIEKLNKEINESPIDLGFIGIGENAHIAFNDPPADFDTEIPFKIVTLNEACRKQQLGEGWFSSIDDVPKQALSMTVKQILKCENIISSVPYKVKAQAIHDTLTSDNITNLIPATILKTHKNVTILIDEASASMININDY